MASDSLETHLSRFAHNKGFRGKGPLCVALVVTEHAKTLGLPLDARNLVTQGGGQVHGLGKAAVQTILKRHGIRRLLAAEGGRTSRGSLGRMQDYVELLNRLGPEVDLAAVESFWVDRVREFFAASPFRITLDASKGIRALVSDLMDQTTKREREAEGVSYSGAVLQHLVGATLDCRLAGKPVSHNSFSTADAQSGRVADFLVGDVAIHVTTAPGEALIGRCDENLGNGYRPVIITLKRGLVVAHELARRQSVAERIDVLGIEQFMAVIVYSLGGFTLAGRRSALTSIVDRYNEIVRQWETDPSLRIAYQ